MIKTTFNAQDVFLINDPWDVESDFQAVLKVHQDFDSGLTGRDSRRPYSSTLSSELQYRTTVQDSNLRTLIGSLRALNTQPVIVIVWPALVRWEDRATAPISGGLKIAWKDDWSQFELYTDSEPSWPSDDDNFAPAVMGFIRPTEPEMITPDAASWLIDFTESSISDYALSPSTSVFTSGPTPADYSVAPKLFPFVPDFLKLSENIVVPVVNEAIGFARQQRREFYSQAAYRTQTASYRLSLDDTGRLVNFFQSIAAPGDSFWASGYLRLAALTVNASAADTVLNVSDTNALLVGDYVSIYLNGSTIARKVTAKTSNTVTIDSALGADYSADNTCIFPLCLVKLPNASITLIWSSPDSDSVEISWTQLPTEEQLPGDETLGETIGKLSTRVVLFEFARDYGNGTVDHWYFTGFESDLTYGGHNYTHQIISVGEIPQSLNLEFDQIEIMSVIFSGNPLNDEVALTSEAPLSVKVTFADFDGTTVSNAQQVFFGDVASPSRSGNKITVKCKAGTGLLQTPLPRMVIGTMCNHLAGSNDGTFLFSYGCTLLRSDWKFTAEVTSPLSAAFPYTLNVNTLVGVGASAAAALSAGHVFANWFANGYIEWGTGSNIQRRFIGGSTAPSGGAFSLTLHRWFTGAGPNIGDTVTFYPGCDGLYSTCKAYNASTNPTGKFNNKDNFGGEPFMPISNPSTSGLQQFGTQGGKK